MFGTSQKSFFDKKKKPPKIKDLALVTTFI